MRITSKEHSAICNETKNCFGSSAQVFLFGSRVKDSGHGGDIDLLIKPENKLDDTFKRKINFLVDLKSKIGDQQIDVVVAEPNDMRDVVRVAEMTGVEL